MTRIKYRLLCIGTFIGIAVTAVPALAQQPPTPVTTSSSASASEREYDFLKGQQDVFRTFVQQERTELREQQRDVFGYVQFLVTVLVAIVSAVAVIFGGLLGFLHFKSKKDVERIVDERFNTKIEEAVQKNGASLKIQLERELHSLERKIVVIAQDADAAAFRQLELPAMQQRGFRNVGIQSEFTDVSPSTCDLIVYWYKSNIPDESDTALHALVDHLRSADRTVPLIVYTFKKAPRLNTLDLNKLINEYPMSYIANMPLSLISNVFSTINALYPPR